MDNRVVIDNVIDIQ